MVTDERSLLSSEVVSVPPADAPSSRWRRFKNWSDSQWVAIRPGPEARRGAAWGTLTAAAITVIIGGLYGATVTSPVSRFASIPPPFKEKFTKPAMIEDEGYNQDWEVVFQTVRAPLSAFQPAGNSKVFDPSKLRSDRLKFDRTPMNKICIKQNRLRQTVIQPLSANNEQFHVLTAW